MAASLGQLSVLLIVLHCCYHGYALILLEHRRYFSLDQYTRAAVFQKSVYANTRYYSSISGFGDNYDYISESPDYGTVSFYLLWFPCARDVQYVLGKGDNIQLQFIESLNRNIKHGSSLYQQEVYLRISKTNTTDGRYHSPRDLVVPEERRKSGTHVFIYYYEPGSHQNHQKYIELYLEEPQGRLSKTEWPLLPFYGTMMALYVVCGVVWCGAMIVWCNMKYRVWIQGSIAVVHLFGVIEYAVFFADVLKVNQNDYGVEGAQVSAEVMSSAKRTVAMVVSILISLGHGIKRPRCGATLVKVFGVGFLYLIVATAEGCVRVYLDAIGDDYNSPHLLALLTLASSYVQHNNVAVLITKISLVALDVTLCCAILSFAAKTTAQLRDCKNDQELTLYKHFRNTVIFVGAASSGYYILLLLEEQLDVCLDTRVVWLKDGFWHILFFLVLLVAMVLWRPSIKYNRSEYSPLSEEESSEHDYDDDRLLDLSRDDGVTRVDKQDTVDGGLKTKGITDGEENSAKDSPCGGLKSTMAAIINGINNTFKNAAELREIKKNKIKKELEKSDFEIENVKLENELLRLKISEKLKEQPTPLEQRKDPQQLEQPLEPQQLKLSQQLEQSEPQLTEQKEEADKVAVDEGLVPVHQYTAQ